MSLNRIKSWWKAIGVAIGLVAITWAVFGQTIHHQFINYDDPIYVTENEHVRAGLNWESAGWAFTHVHSHNWHPLTTLSHMLDCQLFGLRPGWHHFVNVLLHTVAAILLFVLLAQIMGAERQTRNFWSSAFVAGIFAIHPLHVESVAWVSERKDVLSGVFFMVTLLAYFRYTVKPTFWRYSAVFALFALGLMSKPMLVTLPIILLLLDYWPLKRFQEAGLRSEATARPAEVSGRKGATVGQLVLEKVPLCVLSIASAVATLIAQSSGVGLIRFEILPLTWRISNALSAYLIYIWEMVWPTDLSLAYHHPGRLALWQSWGAAALLIAMTIGAFALRKRSPYLIVGWCWYVVMLLPVIGLIQVGGQAHADRYTYLPQIGLYIAVTWGVVDLSISWPYRRQILGAAAIIVASALASRAANQVWYWDNSERLWKHALAVTTENDIAHLALGGLFSEQEHLDEAIAELQTVVARYPKDLDARLRLAATLADKEGRTNEAIAQYEAAAKLGPNPDVETALGNLLLENGRIDEAVQRYRNGVRLEPKSALAHYNLAVGLHRQGRLSEAILHYKEALRIQPDYPDADYFLRQALLENGQSKENLDLPKP